MKLQIKDIKQFRLHIQNSEDERKDSSFYDCDYIGCKNVENNKKGLFYMLHSDKSIENYLNTYIKNAEAHQVIFELLQNAYDSKSTKFFIFYDENYLLIINNGEPFTYEGVRSILNTGDSTKYNDKYSIGRFGIGFKLIYQLLAQNNGINDIIENNYGPIIFSWYENTKNFEALINNEDFEKLPQIYNQLDRTETEIEKQERVKYEIDDNAPSSKAAWLFKIILTCFPSFVEEPVKDRNYCENSSVFSKDEFDKMVEFIKNNLDAKLITELNKGFGTLTFLKLGKSFKKIIENANLSVGLPATLKIFQEYATHYNLEKRNLKEINIDKNPQTVLNATFECFDIKKSDTYYNEIIKGQSKNDIDIHIFYGFAEDYRIALKDIKEFSNFYLFFPISNETHNFCFIVHSNAFDVESKRTNLTKEENNPNEFIFLQLIEKLKNRIEDLIVQDDIERYKQIFLSIVLSEEPFQKGSWLKPILYDKLIGLINDKIPTKNNTIQSQNIIINDTGLDIENPSDFGCENYNWFAWDNSHLEIINCAGKLNIQNWYLSDLLNNSSNIENVNKWLNKNNLNQFLQTLERNFNDCDKNKLFDINFLYFKNKYISINELVNDNSDKYLLLNHKTIKIKDTLIDLGFLCSELNYEDYPNIYKLVSENLKNNYLEDRNLLIEQTEIKITKFYKERNITSSIINFYLFVKEFDIQKSNNLVIFYNSECNLFPIISLVENKNDYPKWLDFCKIHSDFILEIDKIKNSLIPKREIYNKIIIEKVNWNLISKNVINLIVNQEIKIQDFYHYINDELYKNGDKISSKSIPYIYVEDKNARSFKEYVSVFYHKEINNSTLANVLEEITGYPTPSLSVLEFLKDENSVFYTSDKNFDNINFQNINPLTNSQIRSFLNFCSKNNWKVFEKIIILKENGRYLIKRKSTTEPIQCYLTTQNKNLDRIIKDYFDDQIKILDIEIHNPESTGLIIKNIRDEIIQKLNSNQIECIEKLVDTVPDWGIELKLGYLRKIEKIDILKSENIRKNENDFNYKILKLAVDTFKKEDNKHREEFKKFKNKIFVGEKNIRDITTRKDISVNGTNFKIPYELLFLNLNDDRTILTKIEKRFNDERIKDRIFENTDKIEKDEAYLNFLNEYEGKELVDINQFIYVLLYRPIDIIDNRYDIDKFEYDKLIVIDYLYKNNILRDSHTSNDYYNDFIEFFGLKDKIYENAFIDEEKLDKSYLNWIGKDIEKLNFIEKFGVIIPLNNKGNISSIREFLFQKNSDDLKCFNINSSTVANQSDIHIKTTLIYLENTKLKFSEKTDINKLKVIDYCYNKFSTPNDLPILFIFNLSKKGKDYVKTFAFSYNVFNKGFEYFFGLDKYKDNQKEIFSNKRDNQFIIDKDLLNPKWNELKDEDRRITLLQQFDRSDFAEITNDNEIIPLWIYEVVKSNEKTKDIIIKVGKKLTFIETFNDKKIQNIENDKNPKIVYYLVEDNTLYINSSIKKNNKNWIDWIKHNDLSDLFKNLFIINDIILFIIRDGKKPESQPSNHYLKNYCFPKLVVEACLIKFSPIHIKFKYLKNLITNSEIKHFILKFWYRRLSRC